MGYEDGELHVKYLGRDYDVTRFRKFHPGGANTLAWFRGSDVTKQLVHTHHSESAYSLLEDYRKDDKDAKNLDDKDEVSEETNAWVIVLRVGIRPGVPAPIIYVTGIKNIF